MDYQARVCIKEAVDLIIEHFHIEVPIQDIDSLVLKLHGYVMEVSDYKLANTVIKSDGDYIFIIRILANQRKDRRNMAIAQALGTLFLHMGYMSDWTLYDSIESSLSIENSYKIDFEKDEFACNLLMPRKPFVEYILEHTENNEIDTYKIAQYFGVPNGIAIKRGKWMGALRW